MMTKKISTVVAPPKLSLHWAVPFPMGKQAEVEKRRHMNDYERKGHDRFVKILKDNKKCWTNPKDTAAYESEKQAAREQELNEIPEVERLLGAMKIHFLGEEIRIFPEEFSIIQDDHMIEYISSSHILMEDSTELDGVTAPVDFKSKEDRLIYEAALLDGCTEIQALNVMNGRDPDISSVPVMGWYQAKPEYASLFCRADEAEITDTRRSA